MVRIASIYSLYLLLRRYSPGVTKTIPWSAGITRSLTRSPTRSPTRNPTPTRTRIQTRKYLLPTLKEDFGTKKYIRIILGPHVAGVKIPYSRCPPSLHALKDWWDKSQCRIQTLRYGRGGGGVVSKNFFFGPSGLGYWSKTKWGEGTGPPAPLSWIRHWKRCHVVSQGQTSNKFCQYKKSRSSLFILDNRKWTNFYTKDDNGNLWVEVIILTFLDAVATEDVVTTSNNDVNFVETQTVHFA